MNILKPQLVVAGGEAGVDFGVKKRKVLAKVGNLKICWVPAHSAWVGRLSPRTYVPGALSVTWYEAKNGSLFQHEECWPKIFEVPTRLTAALKHPTVRWWLLKWADKGVSEEVINALSANATVEVT